MTAVETAEEMAALHSLCFTTHPRPWKTTEFAQFLTDPLVIVIASDAGFALARCSADEAELLTLAIAPDRRRTGEASRLLDRLDAALGTAGATKVFLEVARTNQAARALYASRGFEEVGRRKRYYGPGNDRVDALILRKPLRHGVESSAKA